MSGVGRGGARRRGSAARRHRLSAFDSAVSPPDGFDDSALQALADEAARGIRNPYVRAEAIRRFVAERCVYTLQAPPVPRERTRPSSS
jgi:transglutaminase-like putative cysteine protease